MPLPAISIMVYSLIVTASSTLISLPHNRLCCNPCVESSLVSKWLVTSERRVKWRRSVHYVSKISYPVKRGTGSSILSFFMDDSKTWTLCKRPSVFMSSMDYWPKPKGDSQKNRVVGSSCYQGRLPHWFVINTSNHTLFIFHQCHLFSIQVGWKLVLYYKASWVRGLIGRQ